MATLSRVATGGVESRIDDYLNDKLQTLADLDNLDTLLENVQRQQALLQDQLDEARRSHEDAAKAASSRAAAVQLKSDSLRQRQADIDNTLIKMTKSETSEDASRAFNASMSKLSKLEVASGYIDLLQEVDKLGEEARSSFQTSPSAALPPYVRMRSLLLAVRTAHNGSGDAAPHLMNQVARHTTALYDDIERQFKDDLRKTLTQTEWPKKELRLSADILSRFSEQVELLLDLQKPDLQENAEQEAPAVIPLLPMEVMVEPLALRFRFHFYGEKPTNRLDKPEYFLSHILDLLEQHNEFVTDYLQPLIDIENSKSNVADALFTDALSAFITSLLPLVTAKCLHLLHQIATQPQLLSHFVHELMEFDKTLMDSWGYQPTTDLLIDWRGLTWEVLNTHGYFAAWLKAEKDFALARYRSIRDSPDGGELDLDVTELRITKPTNGAIRVNDLLETITDRYRNLSSFSDKLHFLIDVQIAIFDDYHNYLLGGLQAFIANSHTAGRLLQGQTAPDANVTGVKGLETLSKVFGSAEYLEDKMSDWSNELFFLEMWDELQDRASGNKSFDAQVGRGLTVEDVASKTSSTIKSSGEAGGSGDDGALFDETAASYRRLKERADAEILRALERDVRNSLAAFSRSSQWSSISSGEFEPENLAPSSSLDPALQVLSTQLGFLATVLGTASLNRTVRQVCLVVEKEVYDTVLLRHSFSSAGVAQLRRDVSALHGTIDSASHIPGIAQRAMPKLGQALLLVGLPLSHSDDEVDGIKAKDEWGFDDDEVEDINTNTSDDASDKALTLNDVSAKLFQSNAAARKVLARIGCDLLSETDARSILEHRIDANI
jgi:RAD50-interacting protein 1